MIDVSYVLWMELLNKLHDEVPGVSNKNNQPVTLACLAYRLLFLQPGFTEHELSILGISAQRGNVRVDGDTCPTIFTMLQRSVKYSLVQVAIAEYIRVVSLRESASNLRWARPCTLSALSSSGMGLGTGHVYSAWTQDAFERAWQLGEHAPGGPFLYGFVADSPSGAVIMDSDPFAHLAKRNPEWQTDHTSVLRTREKVTAVTSVQFQPVLLHLVSALHQACLAIQELSGHTEGGLEQVERTQEQAHKYKQELRRSMQNELNKARALRALMWAWMPPESSRPSTASYEEKLSRFSSSLRCKVDTRSGAVTAFCRPWSPEEAASFCLSLPQVRELTAEYISAMCGVGSADLSCVPVFLWADCRDRYTPAITGPPSSSSSSSSASSSTSSATPPAAVSSELCMLRERDELVLYASMASTGTIRGLVSPDVSVRVHAQDGSTLGFAGTKSGAAAGSAAGKQCDLPVELSPALTRDFVQRSHDAILAAEAAFRQERRLRLLPKPYALCFRVPALKPDKDTSVWSCLSSLYNKDRCLRIELVNKKKVSSAQPPSPGPGSGLETAPLPSAGSLPVSNSPPYSPPSPPYIPAAVAASTVAPAAGVARGGLHSTAVSEPSPLSVQTAPAAAAESVKPAVQSSSSAPAASESIPSLGPPPVPTQEEKDASASKAATKAVNTNKQLASAKQVLDELIDVARSNFAVAGYGTLTVEELVPLSTDVAAGVDAYARLLAQITEAAENAAVDTLVATRAHMRRVYEKHVEELTCTYGSLFAVTQLPWVQDVVRWTRAQPPGIKALPYSYPALNAEQKKLVQKWVGYQMWDWMVRQVPVPPQPSGGGVSGAAADPDPTPFVPALVALTTATAGTGAQTQAASSTSTAGQQGVIVPAGTFSFTSDSVVRLPVPSTAGSAAQVSNSGGQGSSGKAGAGSHAGGSKEQAGHLPELVYTPPAVVHSTVTGVPSAPYAAPPLVNSFPAPTGIPAWGSTTSASTGTGTATAQGRGQGRSELSYSAQAVGTGAGGAARVPSAADVQEAKKLLPGAIEYEKSALSVWKERAAGGMHGSVDQAWDVYLDARERVEELRAVFHQASNSRGQGSSGKAGAGSHAAGSKEQAGHLPELVYTPPAVVHSTVTGDLGLNADLGSQMGMEGVPSAPYAAPTLVNSFPAPTGIPAWGSTTSASTGTGAATAQGQGQGRSELSYAAPGLIPAAAVSRASSTQAVGTGAGGAPLVPAPSAAEVQEARTLLPGALEVERAALDVLKERTAGRLGGSVPQAGEAYRKASEQVKELLRPILLHTSAGIPTQTGAGTSAEVAQSTTAPSTKGLSREQIDGVHSLADWEKQDIARSAVADAHRQVGEALAAQRAARRLLDDPAFAAKKANKKSVRKTMRAEAAKEAAFRSVIESNGEAAVKKAMKAREQLKQKAEVYLARHGGYQRLAAQHWVEPAVLWAYASGHTAYWQYPGLTDEELGEAVQWAAFGLWPRILAMAPSKILKSIGNHSILTGVRAAGRQVELHFQDGDKEAELWRSTEDMSRPQSPKMLFKHGAISAAELRAYNEAAHVAALYQAAVRERLQWYSNSLSSDSTPFGESSAVLAQQDNPACQVTAWDLYASLAPSEALIAKTKDDDGRTALIKRHPPLTFAFQDGGRHPEPEFVWIATAILGERPTAFVMDTVGPVTKNSTLQDAEPALVQQLPVTVVAPETPSATGGTASSAGMEASKQHLVPVYWCQVPIPGYQKIREHVDNVRDAMDKNDAAKSAFHDVLIAHGPAATGMSQAQVMHLRVWDPDVRTNLLARFPFLASVEAHRKKVQGVFHSAVQLLLAQLRSSVSLVARKKDKDVLSGLTKSEKKAAKAELQRWPLASPVAKRMQVRLRYILEYHFDTHRLCRLIEAIYNNGKAAQALLKPKAKAAWRAPGAAVAAASSATTSTRWGALPSHSGQVGSLGLSGSGVHAYGGAGQASGHGVQGSAGGSGGWKTNGAHSAGEAGVGGTGGRGSGGGGAGSCSRRGSGAGAGAGQGHESDSEEDERQKHSSSLYEESESEVEAVSDDDNNKMDEEEEEGEEDHSVAEALGDAAGEEAGDGLPVDQDDADLQAEFEQARLAKLAVLKAKLLGSMRPASTTATVAGGGSGAGGAGAGGGGYTDGQGGTGSEGELASAAQSYPYPAPDGTRLHVVRGSPYLATSPEPFVDGEEDVEEGEERELANPAQPSDRATASLHAAPADVPAAASALAFVPGVDKQQEEAEVNLPAQGMQEEGEEGEVSKAEAQSIVEQALEREKTLREIRLKALRAKAALAKQQQQQAQVEAQQAQVSTPMGGGTSLLGPGGPPPPAVPVTVPFAAQAGQIPPLPAFGSWGLAAASAPLGLGSVAGLSAGAGAGLLPLPFSTPSSLAVPPATATAAVAPIPPLYVGQPFPTPYGPYSSPMPTSLPAPASDPLHVPVPGPVGGSGASTAGQEDVAGQASHMDVAASFMAHMLAKSVSAGAAANQEQEAREEEADEELPPGMETAAAATAAMEAPNVAHAGTKRPAAAISAPLPPAATPAAAVASATAHEGSKKAKLVAALPALTAKPSPLPLSSVTAAKGAQSTPAALSKGSQPGTVPASAASSAAGVGVGGVGRSKALGGVGGSPAESAASSQPPLSTAAGMHNETMNKKLRLFIAKLRGSAAATDLRKRYFNGLTPVPVTPIAPAASGSSAGVGAAEAASMPVSQATIAANSAAARRRAAAAAAIIRGEVPLTGYTQPPVLSTSHAHSLLHHAAAPSQTAEEGQGALEATFARCFAAVKEERARAVVSVPTHHAADDDDHHAQEADSTTKTQGAVAASPGPSAAGVASPGARRSSRLRTSLREDAPVPSGPGGKPPASGVAQGVGASPARKGGRKRARSVAGEEREVHAESGLPSATSTAPPTLPGYVLTDPAPASSSSSSSSLLGAQIQSLAALQSVVAKSPDTVDPASGSVRGSGMGMLQSGLASALSDGRLMQEEQGQEVLRLEAELYADTARMTRKRAGAANAQACALEEQVTRVDATIAEVRQVVASLEQEAKRRKGEATGIEAASRRAAR